MDLSLAAAALPGRDILIGRMGNDGARPATSLVAQRVPDPWNIGRRVPDPKPPEEAGAGCDENIDPGIQLRPPWAQPDIPIETTVTKTNNTAIHLNRRITPP